MVDDVTQLQGGEEQRRASERSLQRQRPPLVLPAYEPERFLGAGAYGEVWVAVDRNTGRRVAIKFYTHRGGLDWSLLSREVEKLVFLSADRYVVQLIEVGWEAEPPYYVMEYLDHGSLEGRLQQGPLPVGEAVAMFREVAVGLLHAHGKGILHCDLKPANVLLDQDSKPRLADFGQSRLSHEQTPALGTLFYMAPEQADLDAVPDARWDVYALGALLHSMLTGQPPYRTTEAVAEIQQAADLLQRLERYRRLIRRSRRVASHRRIPGIDRALGEILDRCLAVDPNRRFPNIQAVLDALDARALRRARRPLVVLGAVGPALLLLVMSLFAWNAFNAAIAQSDAALTRRALESIRYAAQHAAGKFASKMDVRWRILEQEAADPEFQELLRPAVAAAGEPADWRALHAWVEARHAEHRDTTQATSWFVTDRHGNQLARSPASENTIGQNYAFRDYFHGQGHDFPKGTTGLEPIRDVHRSVVFTSEATGERMVAFSVPIWSGSRESGDREVMGVLAMTVELGEFVELEPESARVASPSQEPTHAATGHASAQLAVLVDSSGLILHHPRLEDLQEADTDRKLPEFHWDAEGVRLLEQLRIAKRRDEHLSESALMEDYRDPVGERVPQYAGRWLAAAEPVFVSGRPERVADTGWVVVVQERYDAAVGPVQALKQGLLLRGAAALALVLVVVTALWAFVIGLLNESSRSRLLASLRRRAGLAVESVSVNGGSTGGSAAGAANSASDAAPAEHAATRAEQHARSSERN